MTTPRKSPSDQSTGWFKHLMEILKEPAKNMSGAQVANLISEALCVILLIPITFKLVGWLSLIAFVIFVFYCMWCHSMTKRRVTQRESTRGK